MEINQETEIDLWELLAGGWKFFKRKKLIILSFMALGLLYSLGNFMICPDTYRSYFRKELIVQSPVASNEVLADIINAIPINVKTEQDTAFPKFRDIKGKTEANKLKETRTKLTIEAYDTAQVARILQAIETRIGSIQTLKEKFDLDKKLQQQMIAALNKKLTLSDSSGTNSENANFLELLEKKRAVSKQLAQDKIVEFTEINNRPVPVSNTKAGILAILGYSFLGLVLGAISAWLTEAIKRSK